MFGRWARKHLGTITVALVAAALTAAAPAVGRSVEHVLSAQNADTVDGLHAVPSTATVAARKGKLVATSPTTGRLPNNIIAKAPDASRLDGIDSTGFTRGNGTHVRSVQQGLFPHPGGTFVLGFAADQPAPDPWVAIYYVCPENPQTTNGTMRITYHGDSAVNVFSDNGGDSPNAIVYLNEYQPSFDQPAAAAGEHITFQVQAIGGVATIEMFSTHGSGCHVQGQGWFTYSPDE